MKSVLTIALNPTVDYSSRTGVVQPTRKVRVSGTRRDPGGGGINVARVIARLGGNAEALILSGGEIGHLLDRLVREEGIRCHAIDIAGQTRIGFAVFEETTGLEYRFVPEGPPVSAGELEPCFARVADHPADYVVASGSLPAGAPDDTYARMADLARERGARFVLDTSGPALTATLARSRVFLVKPSRGELEAYAGEKLDDDGVARVAAGLVESGAVELVAVTMGVDGALLASADGVVRLPAVHVRVRSAVGAGDSFAAAMVFALARDQSPQEAFRLGVAAGAAAVMTPGTELCEAQDVFDLFERSAALHGPLRPG